MLCSAIYRRASQSVDGRRGQGDTLTKARAEANDLIHVMRQGINPKQKAALAPTLRSWLNRYLENPNIRPSSARTYRTIERTLGAWMDLQLHEITADMVEVHHKELAAIIKRGRYKGEATANFAMKVLRAIFNFATDRTPNLPPNPVRRLKRGMFPEPRRERYVTTGMPMKKSKQFVRVEAKEAMIDGVMAGVRENTAQLFKVIGNSPPWSRRDAPPVGWSRSSSPRSP